MSIVWFLVVNDAAAQPPSQPPATSAVSAPAPSGWQLRYRAKEECASREEFLSQVEARSQRRWSGTGPVVTVLLYPGEQDYVGEMTLWSEETSHVSRRLTASDCREAASAMALIVALALDAFVQAREQERAPPPPAAPPPSAPPTEPTARSTLGIGLEAMGDRSLAPQWAWGGGISGGWEWPVHVEARGTLSYRGNPSARAEGHSFSVSLLGANAEACAWLLEFTSALRASPCAAFETGWYRAEGGDGFAEGRARSIWWNAALLGGRLQWKLSPRWAWEVGGFVKFPVSNRLSLAADIQGAPEQRISLFHVPSVSAMIVTGVKMNFP